MGGGAIKRATELGNDFVAEDTPEAPSSPAVQDQRGVRCRSHGKPDPELATPAQQTAGRSHETSDGSNGQCCDQQDECGVTYDLPQPHLGIPAGSKKAAPSPCTASTGPSAASDRDESLSEGTR